MKVHVTLQRPDHSQVDLTLTADGAARIAQLADAIITRDPSGAYAEHQDLLGRATLEVTPAGDGSRGVILEPDDTLDDVPLGHGVKIAIRRVRRAAKATAAVLECHHIGRSRRYEIPRGSTTIGRGGDNDIVLMDPLVSKQHARVHVTAGTIELVDRNSANGIVVQGNLVSRVALHDGQQALLGGTVVQATLLSPRPATDPGIGEIVFTRSPTVDEFYAGREIEGVEPPGKPDPQPFPWFALVVPLIAGAVMLLVTGSFLSLVFVAMSPVLMMGTWLTTVLTGRRKRAEERRRFEAQLARLRTTLETERARETSVRRRESPALTEIVDAVMQRERAVWKYRPDHPCFAQLRLGSAAMPSRTSVRMPAGHDGEGGEGAAIEAIIEPFRMLDSVPVVESFDDAGAIGVCGPHDVVSWVLRGFVAQVAGTRSPAECLIAGIVGPAWSAVGDALKWLPHVTSSAPTFAGLPWGDTPATAAQVLASLEELIRFRTMVPGAVTGSSRPQSQPGSLGPPGTQSASDPQSPPGSGQRHLPVILVLISDDAPVDRARVIQVLEHAPSSGIWPVWLASDLSRVPAACRTYVECDAQGARASFVRQATTVAPLQVEGLDAGELMRFARSLAPYVDAAAVRSTASDLPSSASLLPLLGQDMATMPDAVIDRWRQNGTLAPSVDNPCPPAAALVAAPPKLRALVGQSASGTIHLDLRAQGPHALVGGTTGSGKSEFLQSWVLSLAAEYSPLRITFLLVDYKGGAAFADCTHLPHTVGLVTDLSAHLVRRALLSLRAELTYRERLLAHHQAKDLIALERRGDPAAPPALVIVIDEFAALVKDVPEFIDGVVDVAQRGRSLGIHVILATQRPAGVINDNLRANTNLRIALRMADGVESSQVIGDPLAGHFDPAIPGRAAVTAGPGTPTVFQTAYSGGWSRTEGMGRTEGAERSEGTEGSKGSDPQIVLERFAAGPSERWEAPQAQPPQARAPHAQPPQAQAPQAQPPTPHSLIQPTDTLGPSHTLQTTDTLGPSDQQRLVRSMVQAAEHLGLPPPRRPWLAELADAYDLASLTHHRDDRLCFAMRDQPHDQAQTPAAFEPDTEGHLAVCGTSGSGKSVVLRTVGIAAGLVRQGGPVDVYGIDGATGGLRMLAALPHVGAVVTIDEADSLRALFGMLRDELTRRGDRFSAVNADSVTQYRDLASQPHERRILILIDGFAAFRSACDRTPGLADSYEIFEQVMREGRALGIHVALSADRPHSVPTALQALIQRRVTLRMADQDQYTLLGVPRDILAPDSPPGRAIIDGCEAQIAVIGGSTSIHEQAAAVAELALTMRAEGTAPAAPLRVVPEAYPPDDLPDEVTGLPVLGLAEDTLLPVGFHPAGLVIIAGAPGSGRTNALAALAGSLRRAAAAVPRVLLTSRRSALTSLVAWDAVATDHASVATVLEGVPGRAALFIEDAPSFAGSPAEAALFALAARATRGECLIVSEAETREWHTSYGLLGALKASRTGLVLAPDTHDGDLIFQTPFARLHRREFPPGRAVWVTSGRAQRVQLPLVPPLLSDTMSGQGAVLR